MCVCTCVCVCVCAYLFASRSSDLMLCSIPASLPSLPVMFYKVACTGSESEISQCKKGEPAAADMSDVYIVCRPRNQDYSSKFWTLPENLGGRIKGSHKMYCNWKFLFVFFCFVFYFCFFFFCFVFLFFLSALFYDVHMV